MQHYKSYYDNCQTFIDLIGLIIKFILAEIHLKNKTKTLLPQEENRTSYFEIFKFLKPECKED